MTFASLAKQPTGEAAQRMIASIRTQAWDTHSLDLMAELPVEAGGPVARAFNTLHAMQSSNADWAAAWDQVPDIFGGYTNILDKAQEALKPLM